MSISKTFEDNEKIALPILSQKLAQAAAIYPKDYTINMTSNIIARMSDNNKLFISRAELKDMYNKLYSKNTKFAEIFKDELGETVKMQEVKKYDRPSNEADFDSITNSLIDPVLANDLNAAFDQTNKGYSEKAASQAKQICEKQFQNLGLNVKIAIKSGNASCILCSASVDTPKGVSTVFVPVEIKNACVVSPSMFIGNNGAEILTKDSFNSYILNNIGKKSNQVVKTIKEASELSQVDLAVNRLNSLKEKTAALVEDNSEYTEITFPSYVDDEMKAFASNLETPYGLATFTFGKDKMKIANDVVVNKLIGLGLDRAQISVSSNDETTITYAVSANNGQLGFYVPVRISDGRVHEPTYVIANGGIESFSRNGLNRLTSMIDNKAAAFASPLQHLKASELVEKVREAVVSKNYSRAEEALNILMQSGDDKAYKVAMNEYVGGLKDVEAKEEVSTCSRIVRNANSLQPICSHTNLPLNKIFIDKNGDCCPIYRKAMQNSNEGAYFMNYKIFI